MAKNPIIATLCEDCDFIALSEPRVKGKKIVRAHGYKMFFSGGTAKREHGVAFWIRESLPYTVEYLDPVSDRILVVAGVFNGITLCFVVVYGPSTTGDDEVDMKRRTLFIKELDEVLEGLPARYKSRKIVLGDFNARLGQSTDFEPESFWPLLGTQLPGGRSHPYQPRPCPRRPGPVSSSHIVRRGPHSIPC